MKGRALEISFVDLKYMHRIIAVAYFIDSFWDFRKGVAWDTIAY